jgi:hypothetical protein
MAAEAFLAVEATFREEVAVSLAVTSVSLAVAAVSLAAAAVVCLVLAAVFLLAVVAPFRAAAILFPAEAAAVPLAPTMFRKILRCSPISAERGRVAVECHRVQPEVNPLVVVHRREEARRSCHLAIDRVATWEIGPRNFQFAMETAKERVQVRFHLSARVEAMPAIFSALPVGSRPVLRSAGQSRISPVSFLQIVLAPVNDLLLLSNAQIGTRAR